MLHGVKLTSAFSELRSEGITFLYRGILPPLAQRTISMSLMFGFYNSARHTLEKAFHLNQYQAKVIAGLTAGSAEAILAPFERIQTLLADANYHKTLKNTPQAIRCSRFELKYLKLFF
jgi:Mitochondrial carrier protein